MRGNSLLATLSISLIWVLLSGAPASLAEESEATAGCLDCHTDDADSPVHAVFNTAHRSLAGGGSAACTACHGPSADHDRRGRRNPPDVSYGPTWTSAADVRNGSCLGCHEKGEQMLWMGSQHQQENIGCDDCHRSHEQQDLSRLARVQTAEDTCLNCHSQVRAELRLPSRHPIAEGKTACIDCHNPHGGAGEADLHQVTLNDNCFSCHQDKRGPFLWEHEPAAEDCSLCHRSHGSVNDRLLTARGPALCQQCHSAAFHPSQAYGAEGLPTGNANQNLLGKNCLNCHSQTHGSNHPSGARHTR